MWGAAWNHFLVVRSTQRRARRAAVSAFRTRFDDLVRNKLQIVLFAIEIQDQDWRPAAQRAVQEIQTVVIGSKLSLSPHLQPSGDGILTYRVARELTSFP